MKTLIRSLIVYENQELASATEALKSVEPDRLTMLTAPEQRMVEYLSEFYVNYQEAPVYKVVDDHFTATSDSAVLDLMMEVCQEAPLTGASFVSHYESQVESQAAARFTEVCRTGAKIANEGMQFGSSVLRGTDHALSYVVSEMKPKPKKAGGTVPSNMSLASSAIDDLYKKRKSNPLTSFGIQSGYGVIDAATAGYRKKTLNFLAGFAGSLKSTWMLNQILNATLYGWNVLLCSSEMPAEEMMFLLFAMHSADDKFASISRPLNSKRLILGQLDQNEEDFFMMVKEDLLTNPAHGTLRVYDSGSFTTFSSVKALTVREHAILEVDQLWLDYLTRLPIEPKYAKYDMTSARNETIADAKRFSMEFDQGVGLAVNTPVQINRTGKKNAEENGGRLVMNDLAQYNAIEKEGDSISYIYYGDDERATHEPKAGMIKARLGEVTSAPISLYLEPESRRIRDMSQGYMPVEDVASDTKEIVI